MADLLVNLYQLRDWNEKHLEEAGITIQRALIPDKTKILDFVRTYYEDGWVNECEYALTNQPISCYIAVQNKEIIGFCCYDATSKGYLGPLGMKPGMKSKGIGTVLFNRTLLGMKQAGYGYAIIGWVGEDIIPFYKKCQNIYVIPDSSEEKTLYQRLTILS